MCCGIFLAHLRNVWRRPPSDPDAEDPYWKWRTSFLAMFFFFMMFKPSEPHLTVYLEDVRGFTSSEVNDEILTAGPYAYAVLLPLAGPLAEVFGYRTAILVGVMARLVTRFMLIFGRSVGAMVAMDVVYAGGLVAETIIYAYVFRLVPRSKFRSATAVLVGMYACSHVVSGVTGDIMLQMGWSLTSLFWASAIGVTFSLCLAPFVLVPPRIEGGGSGDYQRLEDSENDRLEGGRTGLMRVSRTSKDYFEGGTPTKDSFEGGAPTKDNFEGVSRTSKDYFEGGAPTKDYFEGGAPTKDNIEGVPPSKYNFNAPPPSKTTSDIPPPSKYNCSAFRRSYEAMQVAFQALKSPQLGFLSVVWVGANVALTVVYGWETSMFPLVVRGEDHDWNGSALGGALVAWILASFVATLPIINSLFQPRPLLFLSCLSLGLAGAAFLASIPTPLWFILGIVLFFFLYGLLDTLFKSAAGQHLADLGLLENDAQRSQEAPTHPYSAFFTLVAFIAACIQMILQAIALSALHVSVPVFFQLGGLVVAATGLFGVFAAFCMI